MKRIACFLLSLLLVGNLAACATGETAAPADRTSAETLPEQELPTEIPPETTLAAKTGALPTLPLETAPPTEPQKSAGAKETVDLTVLSATMVYAEVFNMMAAPEEYVGKTVKMRGLFSKGQLYAGDGSLNDGGQVFACIIQDATACCAQGIPFDLSGNHTYPQDYPELGTQITVQGTFERHSQDGMEFYRLGNAQMLPE